MKHEDKLKLIQDMIYKEIDKIKLRQDGIKGILNNNDISRLLQFNKYLKEDKGKVDEGEDLSKWSEEQLNKAISEIKEKK